MNDRQLESFLKENRPQVESDPTFILETRRRMAGVEGIKAEVDRTRLTGRIALIVSLAVGIVIGSAATIVAYLFPVKPDLEISGVVDSARLWLHTYRMYILIPLAMLITALSLVLAGGRNTTRGI